MANEKLNDETDQALKMLQNYIDKMRQCDSNIEVAWALEAMHNNHILLENSERIRKSILDSCF